VGERTWQRLGQMLATVYTGYGRGATDRVWSLREMLLFRVPPWPQPQCL